MARTAPRRRLHLSPSSGGDEGWTEAGRRRKQQQDSVPAPDYRVYEVIRHDERTTFHAIRRFEREHPGLRFRAQEKSGGKIFIKPLDEESAFALARVAREEQLGIILEEVEGRSRGVVLRYPVTQSLDPILEDPRVTFARRCTYNAGHGRRQATRQVEIELRGSLSESLDLGPWGVFSVRRLVPEPLRCFNCQAFGHVQKYCKARSLCGVCSGKHPTSECLAALRSGESRAAKCPNCGRRHHAWCKGCPERLRRLPPRLPAAAPAGPAVPPATTAVVEMDAPQPAPPASPPPRQAMPPPAAATPAREPEPAPAEARQPPKQECKKRKKKISFAATQTQPDTTPAATQTEHGEKKDAHTETKPATSEAATQTEPERVKDAATETDTAVPETIDAATDAFMPRPKEWDESLILTLDRLADVLTYSDALHVHQRELALRGITTKKKPIEKMLECLAKGQPLPFKYLESEYIWPKPKAKRRT